MLAFLSSPVRTCERANVRCACSWSYSLQQLEQCKPELEHVNEVLYGYSRKVHANTQA